MSEVFASKSAISIRVFLQPGLFLCVYISEVRNRLICWHERIRTHGRSKVDCSKGDITTLVLGEYFIK